MSGGSYYYAYFKIAELADEIERDFLNEGKYTDEYGGGDRLGDANEVQRLDILVEIKSLINDLRSVSKRAKELEWYMSGDNGATSYLENLKKIYKEVPNE